MSQPAPASSQRRRSRAPRNPSVASSVADTDAPASKSNGKRRNRRRGGAQNQKGPDGRMPDGGLFAPGELEENSAQLSRRIEADIAAAKEAEQDHILALRLDVNLDVEIDLQARIHGDVTLSLL